MRQFRETILDAYDENDDGKLNFSRINLRLNLNLGKISVKELAEMLPTDENFLLIFRSENYLESSNFIKV